MIQRNLTGIGFPAAQASQLAGKVVTGLTSTGSSSQANSLGIYSEINVVTTTASNTGVRLPASMSAGDCLTVVNLGANTLFIYPPTGGILNGGSQNAKVDCATLKTATCICLNGTDWSVQVGA